MHEEKIIMVCKQLQSGHSAFFKTKKKAIKCAKKQDGKFKFHKTKHTLNGKGWLIEKI